jgi:hypothetical protein
MKNGLTLSATLIACLFCNTEWGRVNGVWKECPPVPKDCPFCGSDRDPIIKPADEVFQERKGCLDCNQWWEPCRTHVLAYENGRRVR